MNEVWYEVEGVDERFRRIVHEIQADWENNLPTVMEHIASECAHDYHWNHGGMEKSWPLQFVFYKTRTSEALATGSVHRSLDAVFFSKIRLTKKET